MSISVDLITLLSPIVAIGLALATTYVLNRMVPLSLPTFRYASIDGLRGYLAFFVFLHHSFIWYGFIHTGVWGSFDAPNSSLYKYFGGASVMVFFMITSFLFFGRLLDAMKNKKRVDWLHLYVSRFLRIAPLFLFSSFLAFVIAGQLYAWDFKYGFEEVLKKISLTFGMGLFGAPMVDGFISRGIGGPPMAGALWTLPYEWSFYFMLPAFAFLLRLKCSKYLLVIPALAVLYLIFFRLPRVPANSFISGMLVAALVRTDYRKFLCGRLAAGISIALIIFSVFQFDDPYSFYPLLILTFFFWLVASGNSFFGILNLRLSRAMGEISFGIYLLHGTLLFLLIRVVLGDAKSLALGSVTYWLCILAFVPILITLSHLVFVKIEKPCMSYSICLTEKIRLIVNSGFTKCIPPN